MRSYVWRLVGPAGLLGVLCAGCMHWVELAPQAGTAVTFDSNYTYRLRLASGETRVISHPKVDGDSLVWNEQVSAGTYWVPARRTLPTATIQSASIERADPKGTAVAVLGLGLGLIALAAVFVVGGGLTYGH